MKHIGENIRRIRETLKLSQQDVADRSEVSKAQISRLENGSQNNPQIQTVIAISTALGVTLEEIIFGQQSMSNTFLSEAMGKLPDEDQRAIKKLIKMWILTTQAEKMEEE
ncbi:RapGH repressor [Edwardsiella tarda]|nr:RapGH repressor [Edwardsiella tarda]